MRAKIKKFVAYGFIAIVGVYCGNLALLSYGVEGLAQGVIIEAEAL